MSRRGLAVAFGGFVVAVLAGLGLRYASLAAPGEACAVDADCRGEHAICLASEDRRWCTHRCASDADCAEGLRCREADVHLPGDEPTGDGPTELVCARPKPTLESLRR